jgi:hypothetical protein
VSFISLKQVIACGAGSSVAPVGSFQIIQSCNVWRSSANTVFMKAFWLGIQFQQNKQTLIRQGCALPGQQSFNQWCWHANVTNFISSWLQIQTLSDFFVFQVEPKMVVVFNLYRVVLLQCKVWIVLLLFFQYWPCTCAHQLKCASPVWGHGGGPNG